MGLQRVELLIGRPVGNDSPFFRRGLLESKKSVVNFGVVPRYVVEVCCPQACKLDRLFAPGLRADPKCLSAGDAAYSGWNWRLTACAPHIAQLLYALIIHSANRAISIHPCNSCLHPYSWSILGDEFRGANSIERILEDLRLAKTSDGIQIPESGWRSYSDGVEARLIDFHDDTRRI